jgi:hypothetical protein
MKQLQTLVEVASEVLRSLDAKLVFIRGECRGQLMQVVLLSI